MNILEAKNNNLGIYNKSYDLIIKELEKFPELEKAVIFGSRAMGNYKKGSDIDIAIFGENITFRILSRLYTILNEEISTPYFIDVVHFEKTENENLKKHITEQGKIIYTKKW
jgi:predicted nucleotidyltransferase